MKFKDRGLFIESGISVADPSPELPSYSRFVLESGAHLYIKGEDVVAMYEMLKWRYEKLYEGESFELYCEKHFERKKHENS